MMNAKAAVHLKFPSKKHLEIVFRVLEPEVKKPTSYRSKANLERSNNFLVLNVEARDTAALRAALNAYLRWINMATNVLEVVKKQ